MNPKNKGFTLLEILIALFIFTILSVMMVAGLHHVMNTQAATEKHTSRLSELQMAVMFIERDLEQTVNRPIRNVNIEEPAFVGSPHAITFTHAGITNPEAKINRSTLQRTQYFVLDGNLIRNNWPVLDHAAKIKADERIILKNVDDILFEYLDAEKSFHPSWPPPDKSNAGLPAAVRVTITLKDSGKITQLLIIPAKNIEQPSPGKSSEKP